MAEGTPVEYDPFAGAPVPVDHDPFAASAGPTPVEYDPFASVPKDIPADLPLTDEELAAQGQKPDMKKPEASVPEKIKGTAEATAALVSGATTGAIGGVKGFATGLAHEILNGTFGTQESVDRVANSMEQGMANWTFAPRTAEGQRQTQALGEWVGENVPAVMPMGVELEVATRMATPLARVQAGKVTKWVGDRVKKKGVIDVPEVEAELQKAKLPVPDDSALRKMTEQMDELRVQQAVEEHAATLAKREKELASAPAEQAKLFNRAMTDAERKAVADYKATPVDVARLRARDRQRQLAELELKLRTEQERHAVAQKTYQEALKLQKETEAKQLVIDAGTGGNVIHGRATPSKLSTILNDVQSRVEQISPELGMALRRVTQRTATRTNDAIKQFDKFYGSQQYKSLSKNTKAMLDEALANGDTELTDSILASREGLADLYHKNVRKPLEAVQKERIAGGQDGFIESYFPRVVRDVKGLRKALGRENGDKLRQALADAQREKNATTHAGPLTEQEIASVVGRMVGGRPVKVLKDRRIRAVTPELRKYYSSSRDALIDYFHNHNAGKATKEFFDNTLGYETKLGETVDANKLTKIIGNSIKAGTLTGEQADELVPLLAAQFGIGRHGVGGTQHAFKNLFTMGTLGSPLSTLTQFGDLAPVMKQMGVVDTFRAMLPSNRALSVYDVGVRELSKDLRTAHGTALAVRRVLRAIKFDQLDTVMAKTGVNASFLKWRKAAKNITPELTRKLNDLFGEDAAAVTRDLQKGELTDNVKSLLLWDMGKIRPVGREDMPLFYQQHPNLRWAFSLQSWTLKQLNLMRNQAFEDMRLGRKSEAVKNFLAFTVLMGITNGITQDAKDFIRGKEIDPMSNFVTGAFSLGMSGKYVIDALNRGKGEQAIGSIIPVVGIGIDAMQNAWSGFVTGQKPMDDAVIEMFPATRNWKALFDSGIPQGIAGAALNMVMPEAGAAYAPPANYSAVPKDATPLAPQPVAAENNLPAGWEPLADPFGGGPKTRVRRITTPKSAPVAEKFKASKELLVDREGDVGETYQHKMADGTLDKPTAGIGHVLSETELKKYPVGTPIPQAVRDEWFKKDSAKAFAAAQKQAKEIGRPDMVPVLTSVNFQLGTDWNGKFKKTWKLLKDGQWLEAADEAARSKWNEQTPVRVQDFQRAIREGIE